MSNLTKGIILVVVILAIGAGLFVWKKKVDGHANESFNAITKTEIEILLADVAKTNPAALKRLAEDPELKKQQMEDLKQVLAFASQAKRDGLALEPTNRQELDNLRAQVRAVSYDREINKDKGPMPPFGFITEDQVNSYWGEVGQPTAEKGFLDNLMEKIGLGGTVESRTHEGEFEDFLKSKIEILKAGNPEMKEKEISEEERQQLRDFFAKIRIYDGEFERKERAGELSKEFLDRVNLQVKLQKAQFLARLYSVKTAETMKVTDEEITKYIAEHPEFDPAPKRAKAQGILDRAKSGEDFVALANEFSEDPGNKDVDGSPQGGIYKDIEKSRMVAPFEQAALALEPGQVSPELVETNFGFHIIKLERKLEAKEPAKGQEGKAVETYDVRHILISTGFKDPDDPKAREVPVKDYVRNKLETEKEKKLLDDIVASNNISVPDDFTVPEVSEEQMQQMRQKQQMQMPPQGMPQGMPPGAPGEGPNPAKAAPSKPQPKKK